MKELRGRIGRLGIVTIALLVAAGSAAPVAAGGWAPIELDAWPENVVAGKAVDIGFQVLGHGVSPVEDDKPRLVGTHRATGERLYADGNAEGAAGHYVADVIFPHAGAWKWSIATPMYSSATAFETLHVAQPSLSPESKWAPRFPIVPNNDKPNKPSDLAKPDASAKPVKITMDDNGFWPAKMEVPRGTTIEWTNTGAMPHQVMGIELAFEDSNLIRTSESVTRTITEPGTYTYVCGPHQNMIGTITVT